MRTVVGCHARELPGRRRCEHPAAAVNMASRMMSTGAEGRAHVSAAVAAALREPQGVGAVMPRLEARYRGKTAVKGKGDVDTYWLVHPTLGGTESGTGANHTVIDTVSAPSEATTTGFHVPGQVMFTVCATGSVLGGHDLHMQTSSNAAAVTYRPCIGCIYGSGIRWSCLGWSHIGCPDFGCTDVRSSDIRWSCFR